MISEEVVGFIREQQKQGISAEEIRAALEHVGWPKEDIEESFGSLSFSTTPPPPQAPEQTVSTPSPVEQSTQTTTPIDKPQPTSFYEKKDPIVFSLDRDASPSRVPSRQESLDLAESLSPTPLHVKFKEGLTKKGKIIFITTVIGSLVLLIGAGVYSYIGFYSSPERIMKNLMANIVNLKSAEYAIEIVPQFSLPQFQTEETQRVIGLVSGKFDATQEGNPQAQVQARIRREQNDEYFFPIDVQMIFANQVVYTRVASEESFNFVNTGSLVEEQWVQLDGQSMTAFEPLQEWVQNSDSLLHLSVQERATLKDIFQTYPPIIFAEDATLTEEFRAKKMYHMQFRMDSEALAQLSSKLRTLWSADSPKYIQAQQLITLFSTSEPITGEMWVGQKDFQLHKLTFTYPFSLLGRSQQIHVKVELTHQNDTLNIQPPEGAMTVEDWKAQEEQDAGAPQKPQPLPTTPTNTPPTQPTQKDTDGDGLTDVEEKIFGSDIGLVDTDSDGLNDKEEQDYGTDPREVDTDSDGYSDKDEIDNGYNPTGGGKSLPDGYEERDRDRVGHIKAIQTALELYANEHGKYPKVGGNWKDLEEELSAYMSGLPVDPEHPQKLYTYLVHEKRLQFTITATLEDAKNSALQDGVHGNVGGQEYESVNSKDTVVKKGAPVINCSGAVYCLSGNYE